MNIVTISPLAQSYETEPYWLRPDIRVFGHGAYALLYPKERFYYINPFDVERFFSEYSVDVVMFNPTSDYRHLTEMVNVAKGLKDYPKLCLDSDQTSYWLFWYPVITRETVELFRACDGVLCRDERQVSFVETLAGVRAMFLPEVSSLATFIPYPQTRDWEEHTTVLLPITHCGTYNTRRFAMGNYALAKRLQETLPETEFRVLANTDGISLPELGAIKEKELLGLLDMEWMSLVSLIPGSRYELAQEFEKVRLFLNLDFEPAMGHWQMDAACFGVPAICSDWTTGGRYLHPDTCFHPYDLRRAFERAFLLMTDRGAWEAESLRVWEASKQFSASSVRSTFEANLRGLGLWNG